MSQAEIFLSIVGSSLESIQKQTGELITMVTKMGLQDIEGELRDVYHNLKSIKSELENVHRRLANLSHQVKTHTPDSLSEPKALLQAARAVDAGRDKAYWSPRVERIPLARSAKGRNRTHIASQTKGEEDLL